MAHKDECIYSPALDGNSLSTPVGHSVDRSKPHAGWSSLGGLRMGVEWKWEERQGWRKASIWAKCLMESVPLLAGMAKF